MDEFLQPYSYRNKISYEGGVYHITQRAPGREGLFIEENDYLAILALLKECAKKFNLDIFSFCFMPNHYHILLKLNKPNLSEAMHFLNTSYAMKFNTKYKRKGHVFSGVYRASMCLDEAHLINSSVYIHLNPQKAGLTDDPYGYRWSSLNLYAHSEIKSFINTSFILGIINDDVKIASCQYADLLKSSLNARYENILEVPKAGINFSKAIFKNLMTILQGRTIKKDFISSELNLDKMIEEFKKEKRRNMPETRKAIAYLAEQLKNRGFNMTESAKVLNISRQSLYNLTKFDK